MGLFEGAYSSFIVIQLLSAKYSLYIYIYNICVCVCVCSSFNRTVLNVIWGYLKGPTLICTRQHRLFFSLTLKALLCCVIYVSCKGHQRYDHNYPSHRDSSNRVLIWPLGASDGINDLYGIVCFSVEFVGLGRLCWDVYHIMLQVHLMTYFACSKRECHNFM